MEKGKRHLKTQEPSGLFASISRVEATDAKRRKALWGANGIAEINLPGRKEKDVLKTQEPSGLQLNIMFYGSTATGRCFSFFEVSN